MNKTMQYETHTAGLQISLQKSIKPLIGWQSLQIISPSQNTGISWTAPQENQPIIYVR